MYVSKLHSFFLYILLMRVPFRTFTIIMGIMLLYGFLSFGIFQQIHISDGRRIEMFAFAAVGFCHVDKIHVSVNVTLPIKKMP
jgi:hypothetical protein